MTRILRPVLGLGACLTLVACATGVARESAPPAATEPSASPAVVIVAASPSAEAAAGPRCATETVTAETGAIEVLATSNIFGAGHEYPNAPAGGGPGTLPPSIDLPPGDGRVVTFPDVSGCVTPISHVMPNGVGPADWNGPAGDGGEYGGTDITAYDGISGMYFADTGMFLTGVFLGVEEPARSTHTSTVAPDRLEYESVDSIADRVTPELAQSFYVGDGRLPGTDTLREFVPPDGATRLFLGFVDGAMYKGKPGFYGNNDGELQVVVDVAAE